MLLMLSIEKQRIRSWQKQKKIKGIKVAPRKAEKKFKKKLKRLQKTHGVKEKSLQKKKKRFKELVKGTSLKGKLEGEVSKQRTIQKDPLNR